MMLYIYYLLIVILCLNNILIIYNISSGLDILRQPIQIVLIIVTLFTLITRRNYRSKSILNNIVILFLCYLVLNVICNSNNFLNDFSNSIFGLTAFLLFFNCKIDIISVRLLEKTCFPTFIVFSILYIYSRTTPNFQSPEAFSLYANSVYYPICLLPWTLTSTKKSIISIVIALICVLLSSKQGAFIAISSVILCFTLVYVTKTGRAIKQKAIILFGVFAIAGSYLYSYVLDAYDTNVLEGFSTLSDDGGNGRADIYSEVITKFSDSNVFQLILGHGGLNSVANDIGISAHNDILEMLYDYGVFGFILYCLFVVFLIKKTLFSIRIKSDISLKLSASVCVFFVLTMVSHVFFVLKYSLFLFSMWGMSINQLSMKIYENKKNRINCA